MADFHTVLKTLATREHEKLIRLASALLGDMHLAEDVVQQTLAAVLERKERCGAVRNLRSYVFQSVRYNALRQRVRRRREEIGWPVVETAASNDDPADMPPGLLEEALLELPLRQQSVIRLRYYMNMSYREIGLALSISLNTAASACRYGLDNLRKKLTINRKGIHNERKT